MICKKYDKEYFEDKTCWAVELSNGETIYQNDGFDQAVEFSAWIRLKEYLHENNLKIEKMYVRFRSNIFYPLEDYCEGYFFSMGIIGMMSSTENINFYILGFIKKDVVNIKKIKVPELIIFDEEERNISDCTEQQVILNTKENYGKGKIFKQ